MSNEYSPQWFDVFLESLPDELTAAEVQAVEDRLPRPAFRKVLDVCCGPGRHAALLVERSYAVTGIDRDPDAIARAAERCPSGRFIELDQRHLGRLDESFDAAVILWQSFGYFDSATNDQVLADLAARLRPGGRLLLDLYHREWFEDHQGRIEATRDPRCRSITNAVRDRRLTSTIVYADDTTETMDFELFTPDEIEARARPLGLRVVETCCWWDPARAASADEQRFQVTFERG